MIVGVKTTTTTQTADSVTQAGFKDNPVPNAATTSVTTTTRPQKEYRITFRAHPIAPAPSAVVPAPPVLAPVLLLAPVAVLAPPAPAGLPPRPEPVVR